MHIIRVTDSQTEKAFLQFPAQLYENKPQWVATSEQEIKNIFDFRQKILFEEGQAERWILTNFRGKMIGRIAAFTHQNFSERFEQPTGGIGLFECIDHQKAAFSLFDQCKEWLIRKGMKAMLGPVDLLDPTFKSGLLTSGFSKIPVYNRPYHQEYYQDMFENYGFSVLFKQYNYAVDIQEDGKTPEVDVLADIVLLDPEYKIETVSKQDHEGFAKKLRDVYNDVWQDQPYFFPLQEEASLGLVKKLRQVMDEHMVYFAYHNEQPIGFMINLPEQEQISDDTQEQVTMMRRLKHLFGNKHMKITTLMMGVKKAYQGKGVEDAFLRRLLAYIKSQERAYKTIELAGVSEGAVNEQHVTKALEMEVSQTYQTYQLTFQEAVTRDILLQEAQEPRILKIR